LTRKRIVTIVGTRPEAIKLAPVVLEIQRRSDHFEQNLVATAQHRRLLDQVLEAFGLTPDIDLDLMEQDQALAGFASKSLRALSDLFEELRPDAVLVQGDTTTVMTAALAAFYCGILTGHVEAGLRSHDRRNPFPEEINRRVAGSLADLHFAPTSRARANLLAEGVSDTKIFITGNTIVDALKSMRVDGEFEASPLRRIDFTERRVLLVTAHRRESHGAPLRSICRALAAIVDKHRDVELVYPVHLNPNVSDEVRRELAGNDRIHLIDPVSYSDLLRLIDRCYLILTDSGGIQEEAPSFHKPVLVMREVTERPELIEVGGGRLVGAEEARIVEAASLLLEDRSEYEKMAGAPNPFGDGRAAARIVEILDRELD
jgi:UDP-N-acetylglucosamine 2-epimerase